MTTWKADTSRARTANPHGARNSDWQYTVLRTRSDVRTFVDDVLVQAVVQPPHQSSLGSARRGDSRLAGRLTYIRG